MSVAVTNVPRSEARILSMRPSSRDGLYALASAWQASNDSSKIRPFARPSPTPPREGATAAADSGAPIYWPDGPSAA